MTAASSMVGQVDAVFTPDGQRGHGRCRPVSETLTKGGIPFYTGADSFVTAGAFATCGVNYTELGTYTADMALDILETGVVPAYHVMDGGIITVNTETAAALCIDYSAFNDLAGQVVEVTTAEKKNPGPLWEGLRLQAVGESLAITRNISGSGKVLPLSWTSPSQGGQNLIREEVTLCLPLPPC